ncbi:MAG: monovalent cation/H+ antiporter subunit D family protein [Actinobacteria bacterium]|nr:monovalent cation/H+ antiporter subunit D family protein [Actinomycetota bacterium]
MKLLLPILIPLLGAAAVTLLRKQPQVRDWAAIAAGVCQIVAVSALLPEVLGGRGASFELVEFLPDAPIAFRADALGMVLILTASVLWALTTVYSIGYLDHSHLSLTRFHVLVGITMAATAGVAFSSNLLTLYLFYEAMTIATYPLVTFTGTEAASAGGRRYLAYQLGTGVALFLPAIVLTYTQTGSFTFTPGGLFGEDLTGFLPIFTYLLFLFGVAKAALVPVHAWLPAAMVAPVPVSALLHSVAVVNVGVFTLFRVLVEVFGAEAIASLGLGRLTLIATSITILVASLIALRVRNLKEILAYSTIGQLSYMVLGIALLNEAGITGAILHLVGHSVSKITLFFAVGAIAVGTGATRLNELRGLGQRMPLLLGAFTVGAASIVGLPPTIGFVTKYFLFLGAAGAHHWIVLVVLAASTLLSATYYLRVIRTSLSPMPHVEYGPSGPTSPPLSGRPVPREMIVALVTTAVLTILLGVVPGPVLTLVRAALP